MLHQAELFHGITAGLQPGRDGEHSAALQDGAVCSVLALGSSPPLSSIPCTMKLPLHHQSQPWGCPWSPHPCHPITSHGPSPQDTAPSPPSVSKENQPSVVSPPSFPCRLFFSPSPPSIKQQICFQSNKTAVQPLEQMFSARLRAQGRRGDSH